MGGTAKRFYVGTHRTRCPEETWEWVAGTFRRVGITRVADVTALDRIGIPVCQAVRPRSLNLSVSQGKGTSLAAARVSAVMESLELWHAECLAHLPQITLSPREMRYSNPIPLTALRWSPGAQNLGSMQIRWVRARSLVTQRWGWLPRQMLELDFDLGRPPRPQLFQLTSSGLASGNCLDEALLHSLCELIERHALYLAHEEPRRRRVIVPESVETPYCRDLLVAIRSAGLKLALHDLTWEAQVPVVLVDIVAPDLPQVWRGSGCHPAPDVALSRALTEAAQSRLTYISGARDDVYPLDLERAPFEPFEGFVEPPAELSFGELPNRSADSVGADLDLVVAELAEQGLEPFCVDLSREEVGVPVVSCFVPGLREAMH